jgi:hypothetical protein
VLFEAKTENGIAVKKFVIPNKGVHIPFIFGTLSV